MEYKKYFAFHNGEYLPIGTALYRRLVLKDGPMDELRITRELMIRMQDLPFERDRKFFGDGSDKKYISMTYDEFRAAWMSLLSYKNYLIEKKMKPEYEWAHIIFCKLLSAKWKRDRVWEKPIMKKELERER